MTLWPIILQPPLVLGKLFLVAHLLGFLSCFLDVLRNTRQPAFDGLLSCSPYYCTNVSNR